MKRDFDLIIKILEYFENREEVSIVRELEIEGYGEQVIKYHLRIMTQANLLAAEEITSSSTSKRLIDVWPFELTWEGHEFLSTIRDKKILSKIKNKFSASLGEVPFSVLKEVALMMFRSQIGQ